MLEHVFLVHWNCRLQTLYVKFNCCPSERNLSLSKRCRAGKQEAYQIVIKTNFCISSWAFWLTVVCHMKNIIIKIFLVFCRFGADTTTKRRLLLQTKWVGTIISTLTTNTWFVITTHTQLSQQLIHRCGYTFGGGGNARSCLSLYCCLFPVILITNTIHNDICWGWIWLPPWHHQYMQYASRKFPSIIIFPAFLQILHLSNTEYGTNFNANVFTWLHDYSAAVQ